MEKNWRWLAVDVTHYQQLSLTIVDFGPRRVAVQLNIYSENATEILKVLDDIVLESGPRNKVIMDKCVSFCLATLKEISI